jgi:hypothetical protein
MACPDHRLRAAGIVDCQVLRQEHKFGEEGIFHTVRSDTQVDLLLKGVRLEGFCDSEDCILQTYILLATAIGCIYRHRTVGVNAWKEFTGGP